MHGAVQMCLAHNVFDLAPHVVHMSNQTTGGHILDALNTGLLSLTTRAADRPALCVAQDLADRYGKPLIVLNLVKVAEKRPRESILQSEFANAISYINKGVSQRLASLTH